jgi:hypothetical protein
LPRACYASTTTASEVMKCNAFWTISLLIHFRFGNSGVCRLSIDCQYQEGPEVDCATTVFIRETNNCECRDCIHRCQCRSAWSLSRPTNHALTIRYLKQCVTNDSDRPQRPLSDRLWFVCAVHQKRSSPRGAGHLLSRAPFRNLIVSSQIMHVRSDRALLMHSEPHKSQVMG